MKIPKLAPTKRRIHKMPKMYGFDVETHSDKNLFLCATIYQDDDNYWTFRDIDSLVAFLKTKRFWDSRIVATNLGFDFLSVFFEHDDEANFQYLMRGSDFVYAKTYIRHKRFHHDTRKTSRGMSHLLMFQDTCNFLRISVKDMGRILGIKKLDHPGCLGKIPRDGQEWQELITYNIQDAKISLHFQRFLYEFFIEQGARPMPTIAQTVLSCFKGQHLEGEYWRQDVPDLLDIMESYFGGRTEAFRRGHIKEQDVYDVNSIYPYNMLKAMPDPNSHRVTRKNTNKYINGYEGFSHIDIFCPEMRYPLLPYRYKDRLYFGTGDFSGWYSHIEIRRAIELGYVVKKVHKTHYYTKTCYPFRSYVEHFYSLKLKYEKTGNKQMRFLCKLALNSLYGKFGQKFVDRDNVIPMDSMSLEDIHKYDHIERIGNYMRVKKDLVEPSSFCIPAWASYVTAYARIQMHDYIVRYEPIYTDTDCLITDKEVPCSDEIGAMKHEAHIRSGQVVRPKFYGYVDENGRSVVRIKGVPKKFDYDEFSLLIMDPTVKYKKFTKLREALRRNLRPNQIIDQVKTLGLEDEKRSWSLSYNPLELQDSTPICLIDGIPEHIRIELDIKAHAHIEREQEKIMQNFIDSDLFDSHSVGSDITAQEFIENEVWHARN